MVLSSYFINPECPILGRGNHGIVFHVSDGHKQFALKVECEVEKRSSGLVNMKELEETSIDQFSILRKKHSLKHVAEIHKIWTIEKDEFYEWTSTIDTINTIVDNSDYLEFISFIDVTCADNLLVVLMELVDGDLRDIIPTPRIVFDIYSTFLSMTSYGIIAQDLHPGNIGIVADNPITYKICGVTAKFDDTTDTEDDLMGIKIIDYTFYNYNQTKPQTLDDITHERIMSFMNQSIAYASIKQNEKAHKLWEYLLGEDKKLPALTILCRLLKLFFLSNIINNENVKENTIDTTTSKDLCDFLERF